MGNKDEKTFTDLFASSTKESETNTQTFSDVLNNTKEETQETETKVTFDSLFEKIPISEANDGQTITETPTTENKAKENEKEEINFNSLFDGESLLEDKQKPNASIVNDNIIETETLEDTKITSVPETIEFNPLFGKEDTEEKQTNVQEIQEKIETSENNIEEQNKNLISDTPDFNPFFEKENTEELKFSESEIQKDKEDNNQNLFFQTNSEVESVQPNLTEQIENNEKQEIIIPIENTSEEVNNQNEQIELNVNPFLNDKATPIQETMPQQNSETNIEINPIFKEEKKIEENPFLTTTIENNTESILKNNSDNITKKEETPKSSSPFFEEEKKTEENPFFQNQLNLIENQAPSTPKNSIDTTKSKHYNIKIVKKKEPLIKFILGVLSYALFIWLLLIGITLLIYVLDIKIRAAKGDYSTPTFNAYVVLTGSMLPEIQVYDVVVTKKVKAKDLKEGDVITFASADQRFLGTIITHRIIKKNPPTATEGYTFQTRGDNNNVADSALVPEKNIFGKVIIKIPKLGYLQEFLASDGGWIIVILIPCLTVISFDTVKLIKGLKRKKYKNIKVQK